MLPVDTSVSVDSFFPPIDDGHTVLSALCSTPLNDVIFTKQNKIVEITWKRRVDLRCTHGVPIQNLVPK